MDRAGDKGLAGVTAYAWYRCRRPVVGPHWKALVPLGARASHTRRRRHSPTLPEGPERNEKVIKAQTCSSWSASEYKSWPWWVEHVSEGSHWIQTQHGRQRYDGYWWHYARMGWEETEIAAWEEPWVSTYGLIKMNASSQETKAARDHASKTLQEEGWALADLHSYDYE